MMYNTSNSTVDLCDYVATIYMDILTLECTQHHKLFSFLSLAGPLATAHCHAGNTGALRVYRVPEQVDGSKQLLV